MKWIAMKNLILKLHLSLQQNDGKKYSKHYKFFPRQLAGN